ncbi:alpha/beta hydrolase [Lentzea tibetensis]|uniref:Alpha/beta hydrolase n=1 Tax=Lentzea tibetensis TaxID=2591470 RepID=A0A563EPA2_9PSEU|nr:alpha/beta fold hydrolase [Lentzea tibetensis]TWP49153.1 alpha/beta hydrolase [Lentzea tibetensis]
MLPGTGSDEVFVRSVFLEPLSQVGLHLHAPATRSVAEHLSALDEAAKAHPIVVGGISLGAHLAALWASRNPGRCAGLVLALPAWSGPPADAPAAMAARLSANTVQRDGVERALAGVDGWLAAELHRAWRRYGDGLAAHLAEAADTDAPTEEQLSNLSAPTGIAACTDDPVHPLEVAQRWAKAIPRAALETTTLAALGADRASLGRAAVAAWLACR